MSQFFGYVKENLTLSFVSWSQGQKVGTLVGLLVAAGIALLGTGIAVVEAQVQRYWALALAIFFMTLVLVVTPYRMWRQERARAEKAEARALSKIRCGFDKSHGCQHETKFKVRNESTGESLGSTKVRMFRIRIETAVPSGVRNCRASLLWLKRDKRILFDHDALPLVIAPSERAEPFVKDVRDKVPEYVDLFCLADGNVVAILPPVRTFPISIQPDTLFTGPGEYRFHVVVSADDSASDEIDIILKWTGDWQTAEAYAV